MVNCENLRTFALAFEKAKGRLAEGLGTGLQNLLLRFKSGSDLKKETHQRASFLFSWFFVIDNRGCMFPLFCKKIATIRNYLYICSVEKFENIFFVWLYCAVSRCIVKGVNIGCQLKQQNVIWKDFFPSVVSLSSCAAWRFRVARKTPCQRDNRWRSAQPAVYWHHA